MTGPEGECTACFGPPHRSTFECRAAEGTEQSTHEVDAFGVKNYSTDDERRRMSRLKLFRCHKRPANGRIAFCRPAKQGAAHRRPHANRARRSDRRCTAGRETPRCRPAMCRKVPRPAVFKEAQAGATCPQLPSDFVQPIRPFRATPEKSVGCTRIARRHFLNSRAPRSAKVTKREK